MIDLCVDARMAFSSGIGVAIRQLIPFLSLPPFRMILLVDQPHQAWCSSFEQIVVKAPIYSIQEQMELPRKIPKCDLFWSPHYNIPLLPIRARKRAVTIHDVCHLVFAQYLSLPEKIYARCMLPAAYRRSNAVIANSEFTKSELKKYLGRRRSDVKAIHMGMDSQFFQRVQDLQRLEKVRDKHRLPETFILFVGNPKPHKNLAGLIHAFSHLSLSSCTLVIVGKNHARNQSEIAKNERVIHLDNVSDEDLPALYTMASLFVLPSLYEGFGLPPLEAMCCGCPTAVSSAASIPEVCGEASAYFHPGKIGEMAQIMETVLKSESLQNQLIAKGYDRVKLFQWQRTAENYRRVFEQIL
jgi:glycosyltransferase involved in cell wall biosynthesis